MGAERGYPKFPQMRRGRFIPNFFSLMEKNFRTKKLPNSFLTAQNLKAALPPSDCHAWFCWFSAILSYQNEHS